MVEKMEMGGVGGTCQEKWKGQTNRIRERQRSRRWRIPWNGNLGEHRWGKGRTIG